MNIGFDAKRLFLNYTGLGNYSRNLVANMQKYYPQHHYHLYTPATVKNRDTEIFFDTSKFTIHTAGTNFKALWRSFLIKKDLLKDDIDVFHGLSAEIPYGLHKTKIKSVVTIHDLIFRFFKNDYPFIDRKIYDHKTKYACRHADKIITVSKHTKEDIKKLYKIPSDKITTVYIPINENFDKEYTKEELKYTAKKFNLPPAFFLYVGSITGRKNLSTIIEAISTLNKDEYLPLVVIGKGKAYYQKIQKLIKEKNIDVLFLQDVDNEDLPKIYHLSHFLVFPSVYEGFGIPVLEALQCHKPVIVSDNTSLVEVAGECGTKIPHNDISKWASSIKSHSQNIFNNDEIKKKCQNHLLQFDPKLLSKKIMDIYTDVM